MMKFYDITKSALDTKSFQSESLYVCSDTKDIYLDSAQTGTRVRISSDIIFIATESARLNLIAPLPEKLYMVLESGRLYIYINGSWTTVSKRQGLIQNVVIPASSISINIDISSYNLEITSSDSISATFIPDSAIADIVDTLTLTCTYVDSNTINISLDSNSYSFDIFGTVLLTY